MHHSVRKARTISSDEGYRQEHPGKNIGIAERLPKPLPWLPHEDRLRGRFAPELHQDGGGSSPSRDGKADIAALRSHEISFLPPLQR